MNRPSVQYTFTHRTDHEFSGDLAKAEAEALRQAKLQGFYPERAAGIKVAHGIRVNVYLRPPSKSGPEVEEYPGWVQSEECIGQDKGRHRLSIRWPSGEERIVFDAPSGSFPGSAYGPATEKALSKIAQSLGIKFVWRHIGEE